MTVIKRNGQEVEFDIKKIQNAITKANNEVMENQQLSEDDIIYISQQIEKMCSKRHRALNVEEIQDIVEEMIIKYNAAEVARRYIKYRYEHELIRKSNTTDEGILALIENENEEVKQENSNKNPTVVSVQRDYVAGEVSRDLTRRLLLPKDIIKAHDEGIIHFHDTDFYLQKMHNCCLIRLDDMFKHGTVISGTMIETPHSFSTACNIATQIVAQVASCQFGGQSITLSHLAPFVDVSRKKIKKHVIEEINDGIANGEISMDVGSEKYNKYIDRITEKRVREEVNRGVQTIQYQVITLQTTNGQAPFITVFMYLNEVEDEQTRKDLALIIEETLKQRHAGVKGPDGAIITPAFPKLIYVLDENNITEDSEYWYLTKLAAKCTAKRLVPDYISAKIMKQLKDGNVFAPMGCRSMLSPWKNEKGEYQFYGRFNQGVVTLNLVDIACSSEKSEDKFWKIFDERLELCYRALMCRHERLEGTLSDASPIHWQYGALARLQKGEKIDKLLHNGYSTISLGYAGLWECVKYMTGLDLTEPSAKEFGLKIMKYMNDACEKWKAETTIGFGIYGTPLESTTYKFAKCLQKRFGIIEGVTDKNYITNSYHIHVTKEIDAFEKLSFEAEFQSLSTGGAISYIEVPNMQNNLEAVLEVMKFMYDNILYAELNTKSDYCQCCGFDGEIRIVKDEKGKLIWECPKCGNRDQTRMNVARRTCGYIGTQFWNQGRTQEIQERICHL